MKSKKIELTEGNEGKLKNKKYINLLCVQFLLIYSQKLCKRKREKEEERALINCKFRTLATSKKRALVRAHMQA